jgi:hypothetical protein
MSAILTAAFAAIFIAVATGFTAWKLRAFTNQFTTLPGGRGKVALPPGLSLTEFLTALEFATDCLGSMPPRFARAARSTAYSSTYVVMQAEAWTDAWGRKVAGTTDGYLQVNRSMSSLAHELAHAVELRVDGRTDETHITWATNGTQAGIDAYVAARRA